MSRHRWTSADLARALGGQAEPQDHGGRPPRHQAAQPHDPLAGATQLERRYAAWLDQEQAAGRVVAWRYEPITLVLSRQGRGLRYTPDFGVTVAMFQAGAEWGTPALELVEVKPRKKNGEPLWLGDSRSKVLAAAEWGRWAAWDLFLVLPNKDDGTWERRRM